MQDKAASIISQEVDPGSAETNDGVRERSLVPFCRGLDLIPSYPSILDLNQIVFVNANLPQQYQLEWRFLFSSEIHGESFSTLIGKYSLIVQKTICFLDCLETGFFADHYADAKSHSKQHSSSPRFFAKNALLSSEIHNPPIDE